MLSSEMKRKIFMELRTENYLASLRLEGMVERAPAKDQRTTAASTSTVPAKLEAKKHVR